MSKKARWSAAFLVCAAAAIALRLWAVRWGLPETYNADEPHLIHLAVSFGGGSLKPYAFKYPTFWPYVLFAAYGVYFLLWSRFGTAHSVREFAGFYAWHPGGFYLIARLLAGAASLGAAYALYRREKAADPRRLPWASLLLASCPLVVELAHSAKPDCFMLLWVTLGWLFALDVFERGGRRAHWLCGASFGLAMASQYTALPAALALPLAALLPKRRKQPLFLLEGLLAAGVALFAASPYLLLDFPRFAESLKDLAALGTLESWDRHYVMGLVARNMISFAGPGSLAGFAALLGAGALAHKQPRLLAVYLIPLAAYFVLVGNNPDGGWPRYLLGAFPALAILAAEGLSTIAAGPFVTRGLLLLVIVGPSFARSAFMDAELARPDTRAAATEWLEKNVPQGATVLLDEPHASPSLRMSKDEVEELYERTKAGGSPRARLYRGMADAHPGGGWRVLRLQRSAADLRSSPGHVERSQSETPVLDARAGLSSLEKAGVRWVVTSSYGAHPDRAVELKRYFDELYAKAELVTVFAPETGRTTGPVLRVFRLR